MQSWALVTGATVGIGESFTRLLAKNGYNIVLVARDLPRLQERAKSLESTFGIATRLSELSHMKAGRPFIDMRPRW